MGCSLRLPPRLKKCHLQSLVLRDFEADVESVYEKPQPLSIQSWYILVVSLVCALLCVSGGANDLPAPPGMMVKHHQRTGSGKSVQAWRQAPSRCLAPSAGLRIEQRDHHFA